MRKYLILFVFVLFLSFTSAHLISDQGTNVRLTNGTLLVLGNLTISIYDSSDSGNVIFNSTIQGAIVNGSWNLMINPTLQYGISYWKDYEINGEDLDFDGNERIEFQSGLGYINNISFINLSLINPCANGSAIRVIYANGSVECQTSSNSSTTIDITNYALKNQSETFEGNITTSYSGLFGFLGSLVNRITKLFVIDIDVSRNVNVSGNVTSSYFKGDGSLLTNLPIAGAESDPIFVAENSTLWNAISSKLNSVDQKYNDTAFIISVNRTTNIMALGFYNTSQVNSLISGINAGNSSFNQTLTDALYYSITNTLNFVNNTQVSVYNDTNLVLTTNSSLWSYLNSNEVLWNSTYNLTYNNLLGFQCAYGYFVNGTLSNGTLTCAQSTQSESDPLWTANSSLVLYLSDLPLANKIISHISNITGFSFNYNQTTPAVSYVNSQGFLTSSAGNASYLLIGDLPLANKTSVHCSNITGSLSNLCTVSSSEPINIFDQILNQSSNATFALINITNEVYVSNIAVKQWLYNQSSVAISDIDLRFWNKTQSYNKAEIDSFNASWTSTYNATYATNLANNSWNQTLANTLYSNIIWNYNQTVPAIDSANAYTDAVNSSIVLWVDSVFAKIVNVFTKSEVQNQYYNRSDIDSKNYVNSTELQSYNETALINSINQTLYISKLDLFDQRYNETTLIVAVNNSGNIQALGFYNITQINNLLINAGNSSFNQSLTNILYASIIWGYNQSIPVLSYITANEVAWLSTYNLTYEGFAYNQRIGAINDINSRFWNKTQTYNSTEINMFISNVGNSSFNQSLTDLLYYSISNPLSFINHTQASVYNNSVLVLSVNSTLWNYINSNQASWNSTYNLTYDALLGQQCDSGLVVNGTLSNGTVICTSVSVNTSNPFNQVLNTSSNVTFGNVTGSSGFFSFLGSFTNRITKLFATDIDVSNNINVSGNVSAQFYIGSLNKSTFPTSACSGKDKVVSVLANGSVTCAVDETGSSSGPTIKSQRTDISTSSGTIWANTSLGFMLESSKNYTLTCEILFTGAVTTTGQAINVSTTAATTDVTLVYDTWSSATASVGFSATSFGTALTGTGSGAAIIKPNGLIADFRTTGTGSLNLSIRSEVDTSATTLKRGSRCELHDVTNSV